MKSKFQIGDLVVLNSHPLLRDFTIDEFYKLTSPILLIKEIHQETNIKVFSGEFEPAQIADKFKYICVYFDTDSTSFRQMSVFESLISSFKNLKFHRNPSKKSGQSLVVEVAAYENAEYKFGSVVHLKTLRLELRKKYGLTISQKPRKGESDDSKNNEEKLFSKLAYPPFTSPRFILSGITSNRDRKIKNKKKVAKVLYKVGWYNSKEKKMSYELLPREFFVSEKTIDNKDMEQS